MKCFDENGTREYVLLNLVMNAEGTMKAQEDPAGSDSLIIEVKK